MPDKKTEGVRCKAQGVTCFRQDCAAEARCVWGPPDPMPDKKTDPAADKPVRWRHDTAQYGSTEWRLMLDQGWEPFAVVADPVAPRATIVHFRIRVSS